MKRWYRRCIRRDSRRALDNSHIRSYCAYFVSLPTEVWKECSVSRWFATIWIGSRLWQCRNWNIASLRAIRNCILWIGTSVHPIESGTEGIYQLWNKLCNWSKRQGTSKSCNPTNRLRHLVKTKTAIKERSKRQRQHESLIVAIRR